LKPFLKYRGGKSKEIPFFKHHIPESFDRYVEPFLGGGALFFHLEPEKAIINDINKKLYTTYFEVKNNYSVLRSQLDELHQQYEYNQNVYLESKKIAGDEIRVDNLNEDLYYEMRQEFNYPTGKYLDAAVYFFINKTAYSGMIRYNKSGEYNVPFGRYKNFNTNLLTEEHHNLLTQADLYNQDYAQIFNKTNEKDFIFLDPPYDCIFSDYGNTEFTGDFGEKEHRQLAEDFRNLSARTLMVISKTKLTEELYKQFIVDEYDKNYSVNIRNRFKSEAKHLVIKNY